jgi:hypothetical protein
MTIAETTNGRALDRIIPPFEDVTLSTGVVVTIVPLATMTVQTINAAVRNDPAFAQPKPPLQKVETLDGPAEVPNPDDPHYTAALAAWSQRVQEETGMRFMRVLARRGVRMEIDTAWVDQFRADMDAAGAPIDGSDAEVYLYHYAAPLPEDIELIQRKVLRQSQPTEEAVQAHVDTFPSDVSGA